VRIKTETKPYDVFLTLETTKPVEISLDAMKTVFHTPDLTIYEDSCLGEVACYVVEHADGKGLTAFGWNVSGTQPVGKNTDGGWYPNHKFTSDDILELMKTASVKK
jgi:hypothetical protein